MNYELFAIVRLKMRNECNHVLIIFLQDFLYQTYDTFSLPRYRQLKHAVPLKLSFPSFRRAFYDNHYDRFNTRQRTFRHFRCNCHSSEPSKTRGFLFFHKKMTRFARTRQKARKNKPGNASGTRGNGSTRSSTVNTSIDTRQ